MDGLNRFNSTFDSVVRMLTKYLQLKKCLTLTQLSIVSIFLLASSLSSAALDNKGTDFIMAFNPNFDNQNTVELHLTGDTATDVTIEYPVNAPTFTTTVGVVPGDVIIVELPLTAAQGWVADQVSNNAVRAFADEEFVIYMVNRRNFSSDAALALPIDTMNTEYLVMDYNPRFRGSQFNVFAAFDNTTVTITPTTNIIGHAGGSTFNVVLNRGEGYFGLGASTVASNNLTGTIISADKPVGMTNGNGCTQVPTGTTACDHIFEVAQPVQSWGLRAMVANLPNRPNGSIYRILASQDNTTVEQDGAVIGVVNRGEFIETLPLAGNHIFEADKPIFVEQFMTGVSSPGATLGDPAMGNMVPAEQYLSEYTFSTVGGNQFAQNFLSVIANNVDVGSLLLDGVPIPAGDFTPIGASGFSSAVVQLNDGTHTTSSNNPHGITVEGYNSADSYIYPGGALFQFINPVGDANPPLCAINPVDPDMVEGSGQDNRPSEDVNGNGVLDPGEDLNSNGLIDKDSGVFFVELAPGAVNLNLTVTPFVPGDGIVNFIIETVDMGLPAMGTVIVTDGAGNTCEEAVSLNDAVTPAPAPTDLTGRAKPGKVDLLWSDVVDADSYDVFRSSTSGGPYTFIGNTDIALFVDMNATPGETFFYVVQSVNAGGNSGDSDELEVEVPTASSRRR